MLNIQLKYIDHTVYSSSLGRHEHFICSLPDPRVNLSVRASAFRILISNAFLIIHWPEREKADYIIYYHRKLTSDQLGFLYLA